MLVKMEADRSLLVEIAAATSVPPKAAYTRALFRQHNRVSIARKKTKDQVKSTNGEINGTLETA